MAHSQTDVAVTAAVAVVACGAAASGAPTAVMIVLGIALFAAPGYLLSQLLLSARIAGLERVAVATGLALCVPILGGVLLNAAGVPLHRPAWLGLIAGLTLVGDVAVFVRRRVGRAAPFTWRPRRIRLAPWHAAAFAAAVLVAAGGLGLARVGAAIQPQPGFTQLWLSTRYAKDHIAQLGVTNDQGSATRYRLVLLRNSHVSETWNLTLADGQTWQRTVPFSANDKLAANLYRPPDLTHPYRYVATYSTTAPRS
ncbi:MAG TPA: DUF1616 domain-containing protein [Streptosporangiaceae bacterium]|nr:DUF1616 domain-containing protein [Streptosporangiaceae bacterium]